MKYRFVAEYQTTCPTCKAELRITNEDVDFTKGRADQRIACPVCGGNVLVLSNGMIPDTVTPKVYNKAWEGKI